MEEEYQCVLKILTFALLEHDIHYEPKSYELKLLGKLVVRRGIESQVKWSFQVHGIKRV